MSKSTSTSIHQAAANGDIDALGSFPDVNEKDWSGRTALHHACTLGGDPPGKKGTHFIYHAVVRFLLNAGADPTIEDNVGYTPLHLAAARGDPVSCAALIRHGAKVDAQTKMGDTAMYVAAFWNHPAVVKLLLRNGADPEIANAQKKTPEVVARQQRNWKVVRTLTPCSC